MAIFHIARREVWQRAQRTGRYRPASLETEGFVHCSTRDQVVPVADAVYPGARDLVLLRIEPDRLGARLAWEAPAPPTPDAPAPEGGRFPHVHGPIETAAVDAVFPLAPGPDGRFRLPAGA